jgi:hypothetical protein
VGRLYARDAPRLAVAAASLIIAAALLMLFFLQPPRQPMSLYLSLATLSLIPRVLFRSYVRQLFLAESFLWLYLAHTSLFLVAVFITLVIEQVIGQAYRAITRVVWTSLLGALVVSMALYLSGILSIADGCVVHDVILVVLPRPTRGTGG